MKINAHTYGTPVILVAGIIPVVGMYAMLWFLVILYKALEQIKKLTIANNIMTILIATVIGVLVSYLISFVFGYGPMHLFSIGGTILF